MKNFTKTLTKEDLRFIITRLPKDVVKLLSDNPSLSIAGGFIRASITGEAPSDIDIFGPDFGTLNTAALSMQYRRKGAAYYKTNNAITILCDRRMPVQFITRWCYDSVEPLINSFDYTICQAVVFKKDGKWQSLCADSFYSDLASRSLRYTFPDRNEDAGGSMLRMVKFLRRGYNISPESISRVVGRLVSKIDFDDLGAISTGTGEESFEQRIAFVVESLLREVDPMTIIDGIEFVDPEAPTIDGLEVEGEVKNGNG